jgi:hypothetical protein
VIALPVFMGLVALYWLSVKMGWATAVPVGLLALAACVGLWVCTE